MEKVESLLKQSQKLRPREKFLLIEGLLNTLDEPDKEIDYMWVEEAEKRLEDHRKHRTNGIPAAEVFGEKV